VGRGENPNVWFPCAAPRLLHEIVRTRTFCFSFVFWMNVILMLCVSIIPWWSSRWWSPAGQHRKVSVHILGRHLTVEPGVHNALVQCVGIVL